jgi:LacI family transcriptional regulator
LIIRVVKVQKNRIGIKDIAEKANVSIGTVDRVIHDRGEVAKDTKSEVLRIIKELGYTPNILAKSLASKKKYIIAILIPDFKHNNPYWEKPLIGIYKAGQEIKYYNVELAVFTFNLEKEDSFKEKTREVFQLNPDGLIFAPVTYSSSLKVIKKCETLNIPYVFFDVNIEHCNNLAYFGQDSIQSGYVAARLLDYGSNPDTEVIILKLINKFASTYHIGLREKGFRAFFKKNNKIKDNYIRSIEIDISKKGALNKVLKKIFVSGNSAKGIFIANSRVHLVAKYLFDNKLKNVILIGYDLIDENLKYLKNDTIRYLICQNPEDQGYNSVIALFNYLLSKKPVDKLNFSPIDIIMKENLNYYNNFKL